MIWRRLSSLLRGCTTAFLGDGDQDTQWRQERESRVNDDERAATLTWQKRTLTTIHRSFPVLPVHIFPP